MQYLFNHSLRPNKCDVKPEGYAMDMAGGPVGEIERNLNPVNDRREGATK